MAWERTHSYRVIPLDRRPHVAPNVKLYMGDARGHWEGNTLVVDTTNLNDWSWLDRDANFHSDELSMVERFTFVDAKTISYQVTIQDPKIYTRPWTMATTIRRTDGPDHYVDAVPPSLKAFREGYERLEEACVEGERSLVHMLRGNRQ
jgi:hypothetical protein